MLRRIAWSSVLSPSFSAARLNEIIAPARRHNERCHLSGMLVFTGSRFLGLLEGDESELGKLWGRLETDERHRELSRIGDELCGQRWFPTWLMGYTNDRGVDEQIEAFRALHTRMAGRRAPRACALRPPASSAWAEIIHPIMLRADSM